MCRLPTSFLLNIESRVKQEVDMPQIQNCVTQYSSPYWCSVPNIRKLASVVPEKNVTEIILWRRRRKKTESDPYMSPPLKRAGDTIISPWNRAIPFIWTNLNPLHPRMFCAKFGWNWPSGSGEEDENVKSLQTDRQTDGQTDRRRTTSDQKSSLELSAQVS